MTDAAHENSLHLDEIVDDLRRLVERILDHQEHAGEPLPFDQAEAELQGNLNLHLLDYISFLEAQDNIRYDRDRDVLLPADNVDAVIDATAPWKDEVRFEFSKEIVDSAGDGPGAEADGIEMIDEAIESEDNFGFDDVFQGGDDDSGIEMEVSSEPSQVDVEPIEPEDEEASGGLGNDPSAAALDQLDELDESSADEPDGEDDTLAESSADTLRGDTSASADDPGQATADTPSPPESDDTPSSPESDDTPDQSSGPDRQTAPDQTSDTQTEDSSTPSNSMNDENRRRRGSNRRRSSSQSDERYERIEEIGSGGVGTVYKGRHIALDRQVAIKEISNVFDVFADLQREDIVSRFTDITQTQAGISHPAVLQIYDLETDVQYPFVVSEYAPRGSLRRLIENDDDRHLSIALKYFIQILHGLNAAHNADVVHGSLKPENVVLDSSGNAKLCDFGLTTLVDLSGASNQVYVGVGAVSYMAPEQFQDPNAATVESDIYSLGIMFYEMLTGKVPGRRSPMPSSFYPEIPRKLDDIFDRMSMDEPEDRYQSIEAILTDFYGEDEIIDLLDRQSGVVFLRDPIDHGDAPLVGEDGEPQQLETGEAGDAAGTAESGDAEPVDEVADGGTPEEDEETDADEEAEDEQEEMAEQSEADEEDGEAADADEDDEADDELADEEIDPEEIDPEEADDEVLEKLDEYSEMFDEDEEQE